MKTAQEQERRAARKELKSREDEREEDMSTRATVGR